MTSNLDKYLGLFLLQLEDRKAAAVAEHTAGDAFRPRDFSSL